jgi:hypothetical protein
MADQTDVRRIALSLPDASESEDYFSFSVRTGSKQRSFAWIWLERIHPKRARVPNPDVIAVRVANEAEKQLLLDSDQEKFFTEAHYNGFPAILIRLAAVDTDELEELLTDGWRCTAPRALVKDFDARRSG